MEYHSSPGSHGGTPQQYPTSAHRTAENAIGYFSHSILAREVVRLQEAKAAVLRQDTSSMDERVENLRQDIANIELQAHTDTLSLAKEVSSMRDLLLAQREEEEAAESGVRQFPCPRKEAIQDPPPGTREQLRVDAAFISRLLDIKDRLSATSLEHANEAQLRPPNVYGFLRDSSKRLEVVIERIATIDAPRDIHRQLRDLLVENAGLRIQVNDYTEGLLVEASRQLSIGKDGLPSVHSSLKHSHIHIRR